MQIIDKIVPSKFALFLEDFCSFSIVRVFDVTRYSQLDRPFPYKRLRMDLASTANVVVASPRKWELIVEALD